MIGRVDINFWKKCKKKVKKEGTGPEKRRFWFYLKTFKNCAFLGPMTSILNFYVIFSRMQTISTLPVILPFRTFFVAQTSCLNKSLLLKWFYGLEWEKIIEHDFCPHQEYLKRLCGINILSQNVNTLNTSTNNSNNAKSTHFNQKINAILKSSCDLIFLPLAELP